MICPMTVGPVPSGWKVIRPRASGGGAWPATVILPVSVERSLPPQPATTTPSTATPRPMADRATGKPWRCSFRPTLELLRGVLRSTPKQAASDGLEIAHRRLRVLIRQAGLAGTERTHDSLIDPLLDH